MKFSIFINYCKYCDIIHRDGEWIDICHNPIYENNDDYFECTKNNCPAFKSNHHKVIKN